MANSKRVISLLMSLFSKSLPAIPINSGLPKNPHEKISTDITSVWVGKYQPDFPFDHVLVFAANIGTLKSQLSEVANQISPLDGTERRH
jgi:hypothetical protein